MVAHLLADHSGIGLDSEDHPAAAMVEHRANGARRLSTLTRRALELLRLGLAGAGPGSDLVVRHQTATFWNWSA